MASGRVDLFIAKLPIHTVVLTLNCIGSDSELLTIPSNSLITLVRGSKKQTIQVQFLEGRECFADFIEMNYTLAKQFQLSALRRYSLTYSAQERILTIQPSPISHVSAILNSSNGNVGAVTVGYELLSQLGIPERQGSLLKVRAGRNIAPFRLHVPANLSDDRIRLGPQWLQKWRLTANHVYLLQYDQRNATLSMAMVHSSKS